MEFSTRAGRDLPTGKYNISNLPERVREHLKELAGRRGQIIYRDLAQELEVQPPNTIRQVAEALEVLMHEDQATGAPFLAALVVSKARYGLPASPFFDVARMLGRYRGLDTSSDTQAYHTCELENAWDYWGRLGALPDGIDGL